MFKGYSSLENHYNGKFIERIRNNAMDTGLWVAREKIHGTNFSILISKDEIRPAKRTGLILDGEQFFGYDIVMSKYRDSFKAIQAAIQSGHVQIFGEFAGGGIQKGVDYGDKDFYVFDMLVTNMAGDSEYLEDHLLTRFCNEFGLKMAPLLGIGSFEELAKLPNEFQIMTHRYNTMAKVDLEQANNRTWELELPTDNVCEGYVLKPNKPAYLPNGSRVAIKCKNSKFTEKAKSDKPIKPKAVMTETDTEVLTKLAEFATLNRVGNVISKIGEVSTKDFGKVMGLTVKDIFEEAEREDIGLHQADQPDVVKKELITVVQNVLRPAWIELVSQ